MAMGMRISELLGLRWQDFDEQAEAVNVSGKLVRAAGKGLVRVDDETKTAAGRRTVPLPKFAVEILKQRRGRACVRGPGHLHGPRPCAYAGC
ncbi:MAG: tyrosine-type recombinase/integrase [Mycobacterium sp.]